MNAKENIFEDAIIEFEKLKDRVILDGKSFDCLLTLGLSKTTNFCLELNIVTTDIDEMKVLKELAELPREVSIESSLIKKGNYPIQFIVITEYSMSNNGFVNFKALSDNGGNYGLF